MHHLLPLAVKVALNPNTSIHPSLTSDPCLDNNCKKEARGLEKTLCKAPITLSQTSPGFTCLQYKPFEKTVGKGEIARNEQFLLFPQYVQIQVK